MHLPYIYLFYRIALAALLCLFAIPLAALAQQASPALPPSGEVLPAAAAAWIEAHQVIVTLVVFSFALPLVNKLAEWSKNTWDNRLVGFLTWLAYWIMPLNGRGGVGVPGLPPKSAPPALKNTLRAVPLLLALALATPFTLAACATAPGLIEHAGELVRETGKDIAADIDWRAHLEKFLDALFGPDDAPPAPPAAAPPDPAVAVPQG